MVRSKATSAHTLMVKEVDYERVEQVRRAHGGVLKGEEGFSLPTCPSPPWPLSRPWPSSPTSTPRWATTRLIIHHDINLGIAVDLDNEGCRPVVHNAEELNLRGDGPPHPGCGRAARKRLSLDDISGGTFSITNADRSAP